VNLEVNLHDSDEATAVAIVRVLTQIFPPPFIEAPEMDPQAKAEWIARRKQEILEETL